MSRYAPPEHRTTPFAAWPAADRAAWDRATRKAGVLDDPGLGAHWAAATLERYRWAYGHWLTFLNFSGKLDPSTSPTHRVTPEAAAAYVETLRRRVASRTVASYLQSLHNTIRAMSPDHDWGWLRKIVNRLWRQAVPARIIGPLLRPIDEVYEGGIELMDRAERMTPRRPLQESVWDRDGLMIALLAALVIRRRNVANLEVGVHLIRQSDAYLLAIPAGEVKNRRPIEGALPERLTPYIDRYLAHHRPRLLQGNGASAFWITQYGTPMSPGQITIRIRHITRRLFGVGLSPHLFRHCTATSVATKDPEHAMMIMSLLAHTTPRTAEKYYNKARMIDAGRRHQAVIARRRKALHNMV